MTQPGETDGYSASRHVQALVDHCDDLLFNTVLVNTATPSQKTLQRYQQERAKVVEIDRPILRLTGLHLIERDLLADDHVIRHDPDRLARAVLDIAKIP